MSSKVYFDQIAGQWDSMRQGFFSEEVRDKALALSGIQPGQTAADIGAGTGFITEGLIKKGVNVIAVDQSEAMLVEMKQRLAGAAGIDYRVGESERLPIDDEAVDYVFANMYLHHVEDPARAVAEMVRILKPGGRLVITDLDEHKFEFLRTEQHDRWMGFKRDDVYRWFEAAGLPNPIVTSANSNCCATSCCGGGNAEVSIFVALGAKLVSGNVQDGDTIHRAVREHYGAIARAADAGTGCGCGCGCGEASENTALYDPALLADLPVDVTSLSLGCGDPVTIASLNPGETVLDLGSGGGIDCFMAARQVGETGYVIGVDMTPDMLAKANANKAKMGVTNVEFREGQIEALPVEDNTIDVIMSNCVINLSPDKLSVFREAFRVLKPGGRIAVSDIVTEGDFSLEARQQLEQWAGCVSGAIDINAYTGMILEAGLVDVQVADKVDTTEGIERQPGIPRIFSARILARKPN
jgi:ubiquinone/menaquinone biosynthesis C-methylase UbiE